MDAVHGPFFVPLQHQQVAGPYRPHVAMEPLSTSAIMAPRTHQLYQLHCDVPLVLPAVSSVTRQPGDLGIAATSLSSGFRNSAPQSEDVCRPAPLAMSTTVSFNADVNALLTPNSHSTAFGQPFPSGALFTSTLGSAAPPVVGCHTASCSFTASVCKAPWNMASSSSVFHTTAQPTTRVIQPVQSQFTARVQTQSNLPTSTTAVKPVLPAFFQPQPFFSDFSSTPPVNFTNGLLPPPDCTNIAGNTGYLDCFGDEPVGKRFIPSVGDEPVGKKFVPCWHSVAANTTMTTSISTASQHFGGGAPTSCQNMAAVTTGLAPTSSPFRNVICTSSAITAASAAELSTGDSCHLANCQRHNICDRYTVLVISGWNTDYRVSATRRLIILGCQIIVLKN